MGWIVDADGRPQVFGVKGWDRSLPDAIFSCKLEVRPGGNVVAVVIDNRPITTSPPPVAPTPEQVREDRDARAELAAERERGAAEREREIAKEKEAVLASQKAAATVADSP